MEIFVKADRRFKLKRWGVPSSGKLIDTIRIFNISPPLLLYFVFCLPYYMYALLSNLPLPSFTLDLFASMLLNHFVGIIKVTPEREELAKKK